MSICTTQKALLEEWCEILATAGDAPNKYNLELVKTARKAYTKSLYKADGTPRKEWKETLFLVTLAWQNNTPEQYALVHALADVPQIITDITNVHQNIKDSLTHWKGHIHVSSYEESYPVLTTIGGNIYTEHTITFDAPMLTTVGGYLNARSATTLVAPELANHGAIVITAKNFKYQGKPLTRQDFRGANAGAIYQALHDDGTLVIDKVDKDKINWQ